MSVSCFHGSFGRNVTGLILPSPGLEAHGLGTTKESGFDRCAPLKEKEDPGPSKKKRPIGRLGHIADAGTEYEDIALRGFGRAKPEKGINIGGAGDGNRRSRGDRSTKINRSQEFDIIYRPLSKSNRLRIYGSLIGR